MQNQVSSKRRPNVLGVHSLDEFSFSVPDLSQAQAFYDSFGLITKTDGNRLGLQTQGHPHTWGTLTEGGSKKQLQYLSFGAYEDDMPRFRERLQQLGIALLPPPAGVDSEGLWFRGHDNLLMQIRAAQKSSPNEQSTFGLGDVASPTRAIYPRSKAPRVQPRRLAHALLFTTDVPGAIKFYTEVFGLRLSDRSGDIVAFLHGVHGSDHHLVAFAKSNAPGLHHLSWDVGSVQDVGLGAMQMANKGFERGWGLGRHVLGSNYFHYIRDPWGSYAEYSACMDFIPSTMDWEAGDSPAEDSFFLWGPNPPEDFVINFEAN